MTAAGLTCLMHLVVQARPLALTATLPGAPTSVPSVRRLARALLCGCPRADDLLLAVTELATNAVAHSASGQGGTFTVRVATGPGWARAEVTDGGPAAGLSAPGNGWGLALVQSVTDRAGADTGPGGCRVAWCEVSWPARS